METYEPVEIDMSLLQKTEKPSMKENTFQNKYRKKSKCSRYENRRNNRSNTR